MEPNNDDDDDNMADKDINLSDFDEYAIAAEMDFDGMDLEGDIETPAELVNDFDEDTSDLDIIELELACDSVTHVESNVKTLASDTSCKEYNRDTIKTKLSAEENEKESKVFMPDENKLHKENERSSDEDDEKIEQSWVEDLWQARNANSEKCNQETESGGGLSSQENYESMTAMKRKENEIISKLEKDVENRERSQLIKEFKRLQKLNLKELRIPPGVESFTMPACCSNESVRDYQVRVHNFHLKDMKNISFSNIIYLAESMAVTFSKNKLDGSDHTEERVLDMLVHRHNVPQLMVHLHSFEFVCNPVAFEVWRREDAEFKIGSNTAGNAPEMQKEQVLFKVTRDYSEMPEHFKSISGTALKRSLFLINLPPSIDEFTLRIVFPKAIKIGIAKVSHTISSAVVETSNVEDVWHCLNSCLQLEIDHREISMKAMHVQLNEEAQKWKRRLEQLSDQSDSTPYVFSFDRRVLNIKVREGISCPLSDSTFSDHEASHRLGYPNYGSLGEVQSWPTVGSTEIWTAPYKEELGMQSLIPPKLPNIANAQVSLQHFETPPTPQELMKPLTEPSAPANVGIIPGNSRTSHEVSSSTTANPARTDLPCVQETKSSSTTLERKDSEIKRPPLLLRALRQQVTGMIKKEKGSEKAETEKSTQKEKSSEKAETEKSTQKEKCSEKAETEKSTQKEKTSKKAGAEKSSQKDKKEENEVPRQADTDTDEVKKEQKRSGGEREIKGKKERRSRFSDRLEPEKDEEEDKYQEDAKAAAGEQQWTEMRDILEKKRKEIEEQLVKKKKENAIQYEPKKRNNERPKEKTVETLKRRKTETDEAIQRRKRRDENKSHAHRSHMQLGREQRRSQTDNVFKKPAPPELAQKSRGIEWSKQSLDTSFHPQGLVTEQETTNQQLMGFMASRTGRLQETFHNPAATHQAASLHVASTVINTHEQQMLVPLTSQKRPDTLSGMARTNSLDVSRHGRFVSMAAPAYSQQASLDVSRLSGQSSVGAVSGADQLPSGGLAQHGFLNPAMQQTPKSRLTVQEAALAVVEQLVQQGQSRDLAMMQVQQAMAGLHTPLSGHQDSVGRLSEPVQARHASVIVDHRHGSSMLGQEGTSHQLPSMQVFDSTANRLPLGSETFQQAQKKVISKDTPLANQQRSSDMLGSLLEVPGQGLTLAEAGQKLVIQLVQQGMPIDVALAKVKEVTASLLGNRSAENQTLLQNFGHTTEGWSSIHQLGIENQDKQETMLGLETEKIGSAWRGGNSPVASATLQKPTNVGFSGTENLSSAHSSGKIALGMINTVSQTVANFGLSPASMLSERPVVSSINTASQQSGTFGLSATKNFSRPLASSAVSMMLHKELDCGSVRADNLNRGLSGRSVFSPATSSVSPETVKCGSVGGDNINSVVSDRQSVSLAVSSMSLKAANYKSGVDNPSSTFTGRPVMSTVVSADLQKTADLGSLGANNPGGSWYGRPGMSSTVSTGLMATEEVQLLEHDRHRGKAQDLISLSGRSMADQGPQAGQGMYRQQIKDQLHRQVQEQAQHLKQQMALLASLEKIPDKILLPAESPRFPFQISQAAQRADVQTTSVKARLEQADKPYSWNEWSDNSMGMSLSGHQIELGHQALHGRQASTDLSCSPVHSRQNIADNEAGPLPSSLIRKTLGRDLLPASHHQEDTLREIQFQRAGHHPDNEKSRSFISMARSESKERQHVASSQKRTSQERDQPSQPRDQDKEVFSPANHQLFHFAHHSEMLEELGHKPLEEPCHHSKMQWSTFERRQVENVTDGKRDQRLDKGVRNGERDQRWNEDVRHPQRDQRWDENVRHPQIDQRWDENVRHPQRDQRWDENVRHPQRDQRWDESFRYEARNQRWPEREEMHQLQPQKIQEGFRQNHPDREEDRVGWGPSDQRRRDDDRRTQSTTWNNRSDNNNQRRRQNYC